MRKKFASVVFNRKKELETKGIGKVEIYVFLGQNHKRYIVLKTCTPSEWKRYSKSKELAMELRVYSDVAELMYKKYLTINQVDMPEDVDVLLTSTERERDAQRIRVRTCEETVLRDILERRIPLQHGRLFRNDDSHKKAVLSMRVQR